MSLLCVFIKFSIIVNVIIWMSLSSIIGLAEFLWHGLFVLLFLFIYAFPSIRFCLHQISLSQVIGTGIIWHLSFTTSHLVTLTSTLILSHLHILTGVANGEHFSQMALWRKTVFKTKIPCVSPMSLSLGMFIEEHCSFYCEAAVSVSIHSLKLSSCVTAPVWTSKKS